MTNDIFQPLGNDWFHRSAEALEVVLSRTSNTGVTLIAFVDRKLPYYNIEVCTQTKIQNRRRNIAFNMTQIIFPPPSTFWFIFEPIPDSVSYKDLCQGALECSKQRWIAKKQTQRSHL